MHKKWHKFQVLHIYIRLWISLSPYCFFLFFFFLCFSSHSHYISQSMNRFQYLISLFLTLVVLIFACPMNHNNLIIVEAIRTKELMMVPRYSAPSSRFFRPGRPEPFAAGEFESEKRRVPTGSNPLHNKRRWVSQSGTRGFIERVICDQNRILFHYYRQYIMMNDHLFFELF